MSGREGMSEDQASIRGPHETQALFGHGGAERRLLELYRSGRQHHALLIAGPRGIGKATFAFRLAGFLLENPDPAGAAVMAASSLAIDPQSRTARLVARLAHPDLIVVNARMFAEENRSGEIKVDHVRWALSRLSTTADAGGWRVVIIDPVDDLNRNAANALLKMLEEPPPRTVISLVAHAPRRLLATIRSRCITVELARPRPEEAKQALIAAEPGLAGDPDLDRLIELAECAPGVALQLAQADGIGLRRRLDDMIAHLPEIDAVEIHQLAGELAGPRADDRFTLFMDMLVAELARLTARIARGGRGPHALEPWIELWDKVTRAYADTTAFNLDRRQLILNACFGLEAAARKAAPR